MKRWQINTFDRAHALKMAAQCGISPLLSAVLCGRGHDTPEKIRAFLQAPPLDSPFRMKGMAQAVARLRQALENREKIAIYGDYDADGITATAILYSYLRDKGARVSFYIPQRDSEGYGLNTAAIDTLYREGTDLIITVDNGIAAVEEIAYAKSLKMDVVVTDHHQPQQRLPQATALVDPHQPGDESPFKALCGAGVALKLVYAAEGLDPASIGPYLDLAAVGTVGDSVDLTGENRFIVQAGLASINQGQRPGLDAIVAAKPNEQADAVKLAFTVVPCINATGRMGSPERAVRLLTYQEKGSAETLAQELKDDNTRRKQVEADIYHSAAAKVEADPALRYARVILVEGQGWHLGVVGIVASKLTERFGKPCLVLSAQEDGCYRGSGRSVEGFDLFQAVDACGDLLVRYGGHPMAAGLTVAAGNLPELRRRINAYAQKACPDMPVFTLRLDCQLKPAAVTAQTVEELAPLEPCGTGNPQPQFGIMGATLQRVQGMGSGAHCRLHCQKEGFAFSCTYFRMRPIDFPFEPGTVIDLAVNLQLNDYPRGNGFDFLVRDVKRSDMDTERCIAAQWLYEKHRRGEPLTPGEAQALTPDRAQFLALYRLLARPGLSGDPQALLARLEGTGLDLGKLLTALDVLEERGLIVRERGCWQLIPQKEKADLYASPCLPKAAGPDTAG